VKILIVGAGKTGAFLADRLQCEHEVTVIEQRRTHVEHLRAMVPDIEVISGDAC
jgi:Trk K+ transport system NAD-binding subunit